MPVVAGICLVFYWEELMLKSRLLKLCLAGAAACVFMAGSVAHAEDTVGLITKT